jgi:outer membrane biosynthesis protein TonB
MQKKLFLQRNSRKGGAAGGSQLKYLVFAAVCLVLLVLVTSYVFRGKSKEITKRPVPDRATVTKEVPKTVEPASVQPAEMARTEEPGKHSDEKPTEAAITPEAAKPTEIQHPPKPPEPDVNLAPSQKTAPEVLPPPEPAPTAAPGPKDLFPKKSSPTAAPPAATPNAPVKPGAKTTAQTPGRTPAAKPAAPAAKGDYVVQVGNTFKDKSEAETVRRDLARKGYSAVVRPAKKGSGYSVTTSPTVAGKAYTLHEQMKIQGWSNTTVIRVAPAPQPAQKPAPDKSDAGQSQSSYPGSAAD